MQLISLNNVFFLALQEVYSCLADPTMKHTFMDLKRVLKDLKLGDSKRRSGPRFTALVLSAIITMAVGTAGAQRLKFRERLKFEKACGLQDAQKSEEACNFVESHQRLVEAHKKDEARKPEHASRKEEPGKRSEVQKSAMREVNVLKAESQAGPMQQHDAIPPSTANIEPRLYTARSRLNVPSEYDQITAKACHLTEDLEIWLIREAGRFLDISKMCVVDSESSRLASTQKFVDLPRIIASNDQVRVWGTQTYVEELKTNLGCRRRVTAFFLRFPCEEGYEIDKENKQHLNFNEEVLAKVLKLLEAVT